MVNWAEEPRDPIPPGHGEHTKAESPIDEGPTTGIDGWYEGWEGPDA